MFCCNKLVNLIYVCGVTLVVLCMYADYVCRSFYSKGEAGCYWLQVCHVAMTMLDYMCVQSFMITHMLCYVLVVKG